MSGVVKDDAEDPQLAAVQQRAEAGRALGVALPEEPEEEDALDAVDAIGILLERADHREEDGLDARAESIPPTSAASWYPSGCSPG